MKGTVFKRCGCRDVGTGKPLGNGCPKLRRADGRWSSTHGSWAYRVDLPPHADGRRRELRRGGLDGHQRCADELGAVQDLLAIPPAHDEAGRRAVADLILDTARRHGRLPDPAETRRRFVRNLDLAGTLTVGEWLDQWLAGKKSARASTRSCYAAAVRVHLRPALGDVVLDRLSSGHVEALLTRIDEQNAKILAARAGAHPAGRTGLAARRPTGANTTRHVLYILRIALNAAVRRGLIAFNPARDVELPPATPKRAQLWTAARVARWQATGDVPSPVMVWTPAQITAFLDHARHDRLYALYHLVAYRGLRRGEACGLHWDDIDLDAATLAVRWQLTKIDRKLLVTPPKSQAGERTLPLAAPTVAALTAHRARQHAEAAAFGGSWPDHGLVFTDPAGKPLNPNSVLYRFKKLAAEAGLPPVRLHDLRHGAATVARAAGADLKDLQVLLGHSKLAMTADVYTHVLPDLAAELADKAAQLLDPATPTTTPTDPDAGTRPAA